MKNWIVKVPVRKGVDLVSVFTGITSLLMAGASLVGVLMPETIYPDAQLRGSLLSNDVVNLVIGLPALLFCRWAARRGSLTGLLCWPGALLYTFYNALIYSLAMPASWFYFLYPAQAVLSLAAFILLVKTIPGEIVKERLEGRVAERWCAGLMLGLGAPYFIRAAILLGSAISQHTLQLTPETATQIADLLVMLLWIGSGVQLWSHRAFGYKTGLAVLFQGVTLFAGLILFFLLQPWLSGAPVPVTDLLVILVMSLAAFFPFVLFLRGTLKNWD